MRRNPCLSCGACCAFYRASFYWTESSEINPNGVPIELTCKLDHYQLAMKGTNQPMPRCIALAGEIGQRVHCQIYEVRSSICRDFDASWANNQPNPRCDKARLAWGLSPLTPESWFDLTPIPRAA